MNTDLNLRFISLWHIVSPDVSVPRIALFFNSATRKMLHSNFYNSHDRYNLQQFYFIFHLSRHTTVTLSLKPLTPFASPAIPSLSTPYLTSTAPNSLGKYGFAASVAPRCRK